MNDLIKNNDETVKMTSKELCDIINIFRKEEGNEITKEHNDLMKSIRAELKALASAGIDGQGYFSQSSYINSQGKKQPCFLMTEEAVMQILNRESAVVRYKTQQYIKTLKNQLETQEVNYQLKYGKYRLPRTFRESTDLRATYEEYATLSKLERDAHRIDNEGRIRNCKAILDIIETRIAENLTHMRGSEVLALRELALDVQADITKLSNKRNSGIKSAMTKQICLLTEENEQLKNQLYIEDEDEYFLILSHPFSCNYQYSYSNNGIVKSAAYYRWINNLHLEEFLPPAECLDVDFTKPLRITLLYGHKEGMDTSNFGKSIIDQLSEYWQFNDELAIEVIQSLHSYVDSYNEGYIYVKIENI